MPHVQDRSENPPFLGVNGREMMKSVLHACGMRERVCPYCTSTVPVGERQCGGCGAAVTSKFHRLESGENGRQPQRLPAVPLLLCLFFPPALLVVIPVLFWNWLRQRDRGWILPLLVCFAFPPAALIVVPALVWRPRR